jgi:hypothetical protein
MWCNVGVDVRSPLQACGRWPRRGPPTQAEPAPVLPGEDILGFVGFQKAVGGKAAEHPPPDRVLEACQEPGGEGCGFVEAKTGFWVDWMGARIKLDVLEKPVHGEQVEMEVGVETGAEAVEKAGGSEGGGITGMDPYDSAEIGAARRREEPSGGRGPGTEPRTGASWPQAHPFAPNLGLIKSLRGYPLLERLIAPKG